MRILTINETLRNPDLIESLHGAFRQHKLKVEIIQGIDGRKVDCTKDPIIDTKANRLILGRDLTSGEAACLIGHHRIQTEEFGNWILVLEDDAQLCSDDGIEDLFLHLRNRWESKPVVCSVFDGLYGISTLSSRFRKSSPTTTLAIPTSGTVAYFVNQKTQQLGVKQKRLVGVADWPLWMSGVTFIRSKSPFFNTYPDSESLISPQMANEYSVIRAKYKKNFLNALLGFFNNELRAEFGGGRIYFRVVLAQYYYRAIERLLTRKI